MRDRVRHAKAYPFAIPDRSYTFIDGDVRGFDGGVDRSGRVPVLAVGSNQSPDQLRRKFAGLSGISIPAQRARLDDFDVVFAAHISSYGSIPATLQACPGTSVSLFVLWLDGPALARMHATEGNYTYDRLAGIRVELDGGRTLSEVFSYSAKLGCLNVEGGCASLAAIASRNRTNPSFRQADMLARLRDRLQPGAPLDTFVDAHIADAGVRRARIAALGRDALPLAFERQVIDRLDGPVGDPIPA
jgi:hypothetical protein